MLEGGFAVAYGVAGGGAAGDSERSDPSGLPGAVAILRSGRSSVALGGTSSLHELVPKAAKVGFLANPTFGGSSEDSRPIIIGRVLTFRLRRTHRVGARSSASETSLHMQSWVDYIIGTHESSFWKRQPSADHKG